MNKFPYDLLDDLFEMNNEFRGALRQSINGVEKYVINPKYEIEVLKVEIEKLKEDRDFYLRMSTETDNSLQEKEKRLKDLQGSK